MEYNKSNGNKILLNFLLIVIIALPIRCDPVQIGFISDHEDQNIRTIFQKAIEHANAKLETPIKAMIARVAYGNVFDATRKLCKMLRAGVSVIFGPESRKTAAHLTDICDSKEIPYIDNNLDFNNIRSVINLYPNSKMIARALYDLLNVYNWQQYAFLYESGPYLEIFNEISKLYGGNIPIITLRRYDIGLSNNYYSILRTIRKSKDRSIVVVGSLETVTVLLEQAQEVGIITDEFEYIIGNLDFHSIDLRRYSHSECNMTAFRIVDPEDPHAKQLFEELGHHSDPNFRNISCPLTTNMALLYDAVQLFAETTNHITFTSTPIRCDQDDQLDNGFTISNYLAFSNMKGLSGQIHFDRNLRTHFDLDIIELTTSGLIKVGNWSTTLGVSMNRSTLAEDSNGELLVNKTFVILTSLTPPYGMRKKSDVKLVGNDQFEGFGIDLIKEIALKLGFNYTFRLQEDNDYGSYDPTTGVTTGMMKEIREYNADMAITDLTITSERELGVDFTIPFMNLGISILYKKAQKEPPKLLSFMDPFSEEVWVYLGLAYLVVSLSYFILGRLSPTEWDNPYPCIENPTELENQFTLSNSLWATIGTILQQGSEIAPKAASTRTIGSIWGFFTLIMVSSYTANLAAFLTLEPPVNTITDVNDLANNKFGVKYGAKLGGSTMKFFEASTNPVYVKMHEYMKAHSELLPTKNEDGVDNVLNSNYAFLMESTSIEYNVERNCNLTQIGGLLDEKGYGIAMRKDWYLRDKLSYAVLELQESGKISKLKMKWWQEVTEGCSKKKKENEVAEALGMPNLGGVYFVLLVASATATTFGIFKWFFHVCRRAYVMKVPLKTELIDELKFVLNFSKNVKIVKTVGSSYSRNSSITMESIKTSNSEEDTAKLTK